MARDYAKRVYKEPKKGNFKWLALGIMVMIVLVGLGFWIKFHDSSVFLSRIKTMLGKRPAVVATNATKKQQTTSEPEIRFSFYDALPNMKVEVAKRDQPQSQPKALVKVDESKATKIAVSTNNTVSTSESPTYFLQFGIYKESSSASQLRLSLLLAGIETEVEEVTSDKKKMFRVWQGTFKTLAEAKSYQAKWQSKGIESIIKKED
jgi:cell division protein FtsN